MQNLLKKLQAPFDLKDFAWRVTMSGFKSNGDPWIAVAPYVTNRAIQERLDMVVGPERWQNKLEPLHDAAGGMLCGVSIKIDDEWITKWDGASDSEQMPVKGAVSNAMKRAAVQWGIGRYLYGIGGLYGIISQNGRYRVKIKDKDGTQHPYRWDPPDVPALTGE